MTPTPAQIEAARLNRALRALRDEPGVVISNEQMAKALTAAAEVGEVKDFFADAMILGKEAENATIERCAKVVDEYELRGWHNRLATLAAAIRKLKDE